MWSSLVCLGGCHCTLCVGVRGGVGGEWIRGLALGFTNSVGTG